MKFEILPGRRKKGFNYLVQFINLPIRSMLKNETSFHRIHLWKIKWGAIQNYIVYITFSGRNFMKPNRIWISSELRKSNTFSFLSKEFCVLLLRSNDGFTCILRKLTASIRNTRLIGFVFVLILHSLVICDSIGKWFSWDNKRKKNSFSFLLGHWMIIIFIIFMRTEIGYFPIGCYLK